jgi:ribonuclease Z
MADHPAAIVDVTLLGTGNPLPDPLRAGPSTLVQAGGVNLMIDCGRGSLMRLAAVGLWPPALHAVLLTHLHSDHICDFNDVLTTRWVMSPTESPLPVIGPPGTKAFVDATLAMLRDDIGWRIAHHADLHAPPVCVVTEITDGAIADGGPWPGVGLRVIVAPTDHRPVTPTVGYRFEHGGVAVAVVGDTLPCAGVDRLSSDAALYVQTVVREALVRQIPSRRLQDILDYHSSATQAGETAARNRVGTLVMTHMVPAPADAAAEQGWIDDAAASFSGKIVVGHDLQSFRASYLQETPG